MLEQLEARWCPAVNVLTYHNDIASTGLNDNETVLTPANVNVNSFGKLATAALDGQVYAQPLVDTGVTIASGVNTTAGAAGTHDVVFVATEHDSLYAIDAKQGDGGAVLWKRSFLDITTPGYSGSTPGTNINNTPINGTTTTSITTVTRGDVAVNIGSEVGITGTPVIDPNYEHDLPRRQDHGDHWRRHVLRPAAARDQHRRRHRSSRSLSHWRHDQ